VLALAALATLDLAVAHRGLNPTVERAFAERVPDVVDVLRRDGARRVYAFDYLMHPQGSESLRPRSLPAYQRLPRSFRHLVDTQAFLLSAPRWGLRGSYEYNLVGLEPRPRRGLRLLVIAVERDPDQLLRLLQVGGVTHVVALHRQGLERLEPLVTLSHSAVGEIHVYRVPGTLPMAMAVAGRHVGRGWPAYRTLLDPSFDPRTTAILPEGEPREAPVSSAGEAEVLEERSDRLRVRTSTDSPGLLLVTDGFDAGWQATVDGEPVPVMRANLAFRAVSVPAGTHEVALVYRPPGLVRGLGLSGLALGVTLAVLAGRRRFSRPGDDGASPEPTETG
jgi:hypothetical protein